MSQKEKGTLYSKSKSNLLYNRKMVGTTVVHTFLSAATSRNDVHLLISFNFSRKTINVIHELCITERTIL